MTATESHKPVVVLCHGAFHVAAHYEPLQEELEHRGFKVTNKNLPCNNGAVPPDTKFQDDLDQFRSTLLLHLEEGEDVVVAMHSMGGCVGTHATLGLGPEDIKSFPSKSAGRIVSLVYIASFPNKLEGPLEDPHHGALPKYLNIDAAHGVARVVDEYVNECYFNDLNVEQQNWARSNLVPFPLDRLSESAVGTAPQMPAYKSIPTTYVITEEDYCIPTAGQEAMVARVKEELGVEFKQVRVRASHSVVISMPSVVADAVENSY